MLSRPSDQAAFANQVLPHEQATDAERHLIQKKAAQNAVARHVAHVLSVLLVHWAVRCMQARSFDAFREVAPSLVPKIVLIGQIGDDLAKLIGDLVEKFEIGTPGAIAGRYVYDALLALLFAAHGLENPRRKDWTRILARYEFERRLDGNDEAMLLDPEVLCSCIDQDEFFKMMRGFGARLGPLNAESQKDHLHLLDAVGRIFPEEIDQFFQPELVHDPARDDAEALERSIGTFQNMAADPREDISQMMIAALLRGLQRRRPGIMEPAIRAMWSDAAARLSPERRIKFARRAIEALNLSHRFNCARDIAAEAEGLLPSADELDPFERSTLLNEVGNCLRYAGSFPAALQRYEAAEAALGEESGRNKRVITRNRAIVLRSMQRYADARDIFRKLQSETRDIERLQNVVSEGACLLAMGEEQATLTLLDEHAGLAEGHALSHPAVLEYTSLRAQLLLQDRPDEADALATLLLDAAPGSDPAVAAVAARVKLAAAARGGNHANQKARTDEAIATLHRALEQARQAKGLPDLLIGLTEELNLTLTRLDRREEAERVVREALEQVDPETAPRGWLLCLYAFRHAVHRVDSAAASKDALAGLRWIDRSLGKGAATSDAIAFLAPHADQIAELTNFIIRSGIRAGAELQQMARTAADLIAAPILTARVRGRAGLPSAMTDPTAELTRTNELGRETPAAFIQAVKLSDEIGLLTSAPVRDRLDSRLHVLEIDPGEIDATLRRLDFYLRHASPNAHSLNLEQLRGWPELAHALDAAVSDVPLDVPLCIIPGPLSSLPFSLVFGSKRPVSFAPSLGSMLALRKRRRSMKGSLAWRPQRTFEFAVWRLGDKIAVRDALQSAVIQGEAIARKHGLAFDANTGTDADGPALLAGLSHADLTRIACHGRILPNQDAVDLMVASGGLLPPAAATALESSDAKGHVLGWRQLADLHDASPIVMSSACDSGAAVLHAGGERLGLERPLFAAGTIAFVAPQWPVPATSIQRVMLTILETYLAEPTRSLAAILTESRNQAIAAGLPPLAACAPAVFGDGL